MMKELKHFYPFLTTIPVATLHSILPKDQVQDPCSVILPTIYALAGGTFSSVAY